jgi:hypothetical protein
MNRTEIKGKHLSSIPVYLINWKISFKYEGDKNGLVIYYPIDLVKEILKFLGFDLNDFEITKKR